MNSKVRRLFTEKMTGFDIEAQHLFHELKDLLGIKALQKLRIVNRYDVSGISDEEYESAKNLIFSEPPVDHVYQETLEIHPRERAFAVEFLPGQYDQRADSAIQCIQILSRKDTAVVKAAKVILLKGEISDADFQRIKEYCINPVDSREASLEKPKTLEQELEIPEDIEILHGFISLEEEQLKGLMQDMGFAMTLEDLEFCQVYFRNEERRDPTITEIRVIDTYWSDHCRHTTFLTQLEDAKIEESPLNHPVKKAYQEYIETRQSIYGDRLKPECLMDIATIGMKELKRRGMLKDLDESDEINACSIIVDVDVDGEQEEYLVMFKNETHNHPTEIEPFGGAATCLGGAIRDPLSGRAYVYQAMRVTGSGDPRTRLEDTLPGKLPQRKITTGAAAGYSSYGNQIGLATGHVAEVYDEGFIAKRMEIGAVIGAAPRKNVVREKPVEEDCIILLGGRTGRDGCGGATGSSKAHTEESILSCGAEVQKGNPPTERKIQRFFRNPAVSTMIKRCNDFGAGGVCVAIGELADGLEIDLDAVPKKYEGLDGTELAISESQERMAVVIDPKNAEHFIAMALEENLEANLVAVVKADERLRMKWRGKTIVDISRAFLNTNGVIQTASPWVKAPDVKKNYFQSIPSEIEESLGDLKKAWMTNLERLNVCSQKGLVERFDSTIGAGTVLMPFGGKHQLTPAQCMVAKIPLIQGETRTGTVMSFGYDPMLAKWSPFHGAVYAIVEAASRVVSTGGDFSKIRLTLQEYFERLEKEPERWGKPFSALLGAYYAQMRLGIPAIGGKDSMSGSFMDLSVPPTLVAFAVAALDISHVISPEFKRSGSPVVMIPIRREEDDLPDFEDLKKKFRCINGLIKQGKVLSAHTVGTGGIAEAISKMGFGNKIGMAFADQWHPRKLFLPLCGSIILELDGQAGLSRIPEGVEYENLGCTQENPVFCINGTEIDMEEAIRHWQHPSESTFPTKAEAIAGKLQTLSFDGRNVRKPSFSIARPRVFIPVFPGTNCEYDSARCFEKAGAEADMFVIRNLSAQDIEYSMKAMADAITKAQMIMIPGGFSAGDEPEGSGKFIAAVFRNPWVKEAVMDLLKNRDGLMLGICNGFQALIKLGLLPYGEIMDIGVNAPTLTFNTLGRHVSCMVRTRVVSSLSPWLAYTEPGDVHTIAVSHGEGRFAAAQDELEKLIRNGQITTQYVDLEGQASYDIAYNPNGSLYAIEGISSPDGRILGKMGHSERVGDRLAVNVPGKKDQRLFQAGVDYFK